MLPPQAREYAVEPVGVATINPSAYTTVIFCSPTNKSRLTIRVGCFATTSFKHVKVSVFTGNGVKKPSEPILKERIGGMASGKS
eukprot:maker-scaffold_2-snap-gene-19.36-mRNA-1 protein AED:0.32 eAED:0.42 QI:405/0/0.5/1/0/0/2/0/83